MSRITEKDKRSQKFEKPKETANINRLYNDTEELFHCLMTILQQHRKLDKKQLKKKELKY